MGVKTGQNDSDILSTLVQAFSALSIFVFYFGWVWQDAYLQMFGIRISAFDFPFYHFLIQGLKVNFPFQIESQSFTRWEYFAWIINAVLVGVTLIGNTSSCFKRYYSRRPLLTVIALTCLLAGLFIGVHYVGTNAGHERARAVLLSPGQLRTVVYEYHSAPTPTPKRLYGYLLMLTKDRLYVLQATDLQVRPQLSEISVLSIISLDHLAYVKTVGYLPTR